MIQFLVAGAYVQQVLLSCFELIGPGNEQPLLCDPVDARVIGRGTEGEIDHRIKSLQDRIARTIEQWPRTSLYFGCFVSGPTCLKSWSCTCNINALLP